MIFDMHVHTYLSGDSSVKPEDYLLWINSFLRREIDLEGVVFVEHQDYNSYSKATYRDYQSLENHFGLRIFQGYELDTDCGHFLCYGLGDYLESVTRNNGQYLAKDLLEKAEKHEAIVIPAHPGRKNTGLISYMDKIAQLPPFQVIEKLNGSSTREENEWASRLAQSKGFSGIGGSDAHYVTQIGKCLTSFAQSIKTEEELIFHLRNSNYEAVYSK